MTSVLHVSTPPWKYSPKNKYFFANFNNDRELSLDDKTKYYVDRSAGGQVESLHEVTQLG